MFAGEERREEPTPRPIALPAAAEANTAAEPGEHGAVPKQYNPYSVLTESLASCCAAVAEMRTSSAPLPKKRTSKAKTKSQTQRQREAAEKAAGASRISRLLSTADHSDFI